jgi:hypothetical protein
MNLTEILAIFGVFVVMWWVGRRAAHALDRYELMKDQRKAKTEAIERRDAISRRRNSDRPRVAMESHARPSARASGSR